MNILTIPKRLTGFSGKSFGPFNYLRSFFRRPRKPVPAGSVTEHSYPRLEKGRVVYAIGDIHGRSDLLNGCHAAIDRDRAALSAAKIQEVYLGDYVDRGNDTSGVIRMLRNRAVDNDIICLLGNHELILRQLLDGEVPAEYWLEMGGLATAVSYGLRPPLPTDLGPALARRMPVEDREWLESLLLNCRIENYFFAHAGVRPGILLEDQKQSDLVWIREPFLTHPGSFGAIVVHGHTPVRSADFQPNRINIDTGAYATGQLTCIRICDQGVRVIPSNGA